MAQATRQVRPYTREQFLAWEATEPDRWEFIGGKVKMMAGGSTDHNLIAGNIFAALHTALLDTPCEPFQQNQKLAPEANDDVTYPDVFVTCRLFTGREQTLSQATVIVEVLSPSTRADDVDGKWRGYQLIPDLRHYLIVDQDEAAVILYSRSAEGEDWRFRRIEGLAGAVELTAIGITLGMAQIYRRTGAARGVE